MPDFHDHTNSLIHETSPYLLQHAHNPVDWHPWGDAALEKAAREDKLILVSIGYSACHWCHVMERESFEDDGIAGLMNAGFVCIKVDREERPDVDQVYMNAVQLLSGHGGWPLNCFALPDGRPVYGGTYYRPSQWRDVLRSLSDLWRSDRAKVLKHAEQLTEGVRNSEKIGPMEVREGGEEDGREPHTLDEARAMVEAWKPLFDRTEGGMNRAPKFPLPSNWRFLLRFGEAAGDEDVKAQVRLTLDRMARGGIYDHLGGGFARYSTDALWKAPHFEKMLYDNAQLLELYAEAFQATADPLYRTVVVETAAFVERELTSPEGVFYSALDADSEGEEGKFYVWTREELEKILGDRFPLFRDAYSVNSDGYWEEGNYILLKRGTDAELAAAAGLPEGEWRRRIDLDRKELLALRELRVHPGLDDKTLIGWNAMMAKGLLAAHAALGEDRYLAAARKNLEFIHDRARTPDGGLYRAYKAGRFSIPAFLEDYAFAAEAFLALYQATFEEKWAAAAKGMAEYALAHFHDEVSGLCFFTSAKDKPLIARKMEIMDNVIPSSNSVLARVLLHLASLYGEDRYRGIAATMLERVRPQLPTYGSGFSNWGMVLLDLALPFHEVVVTGPGAGEAAKSLRRWYLPDAVLAGENAGRAGENAGRAGENAGRAGENAGRAGENAGRAGENAGRAGENAGRAGEAGEVSGGSLPLLEGRLHPGRTLIHVCRNRACGLPVESVAAALAQLGRSAA